MRKHNPKTILKILGLSIIIVVILNIGGVLLSANSDAQNTSIADTQSNSHSFISLSQPKIMTAGVAIGTSISTKDGAQTAAQKNIFTTVFSSSSLMNLSPEEKQDLIAYNMQLSSEYKNILGSDIPGIIRGSYNKRSTINTLLDQLEYRYINAREETQNLNRQKESLLADMSAINTKIENLKTKINTDFSKNDAQASTENIDVYLELKKEFFFARTYVVYINHFLERYNSLNTYNLALADTIKNNIDALVKDIQVVIPDSGTYFINKFELIIPQ